MGRKPTGGYLAVAIVAAVSVASALAIHRRERQLESLPGVAVRSPGVPSVAAADVRALVRRLGQARGCSGR